MADDNAPRYVIYERTGEFFPIPIGYSTSSLQDAQEIALSYVRQVMLDDLLAYRSPEIPRNLEAEENFMNSVSIIWHQEQTKPKPDNVWFGTLHVSGTMTMYPLSSFAIRLETE